MDKGEPPSASSLTPATFLIGKNRRGNWVVQDPSGCEAAFLSTELRR